MNVFHPSLDLLATKLNTVYQRAEARDYLDVHAMLQAGFALADGLDYARQVHGPHWNPMLRLQALCYFGEAQLQTLPESVKLALTSAVRAVR